MFKPAASFGWDVRQNKERRRKLMRLRLQGMLKQDPFSKYALRHLLRLHKSHLSRLHLLGVYRLRARAKSAQSSDQIIFARLLLWFQDWEGAKEAFLATLKKNPDLHRAQMGLLQSYAGLEQHDVALKLFFQLLPKIKGSLREKLLLQFLKMALQQNATSSWQSILVEIRRASWFLSQRLNVARMLVRHSAYAPAQLMYVQEIKVARGGLKVRLLVELSRAALQAQSTEDALKYLRQAKAIKSLHRWYAWEMQMLEVAIFRQKKTLEALVKTLAKRWSKARDAQRLVLLGQLYEEVDQPYDAERIYLRVLQFHPTLQAPRNKLLTMYKSRGDQLRYRHQLEQMVAHQAALPVHYLTLARLDLKASGLLAQPRWRDGKDGAKGGNCGLLSNISQHHYKVMDVFGRYTYRYRHLGKVKGPARQFCRKAGWERHRHRSWAAWRKGLSSKARQAILARAVKWLRLSRKQFPQNWDAMLLGERLLESHGLYKQLPAVHSAMESAVENDLEQLSTMRDILRHRGKKDAFPAMLKRLVGRQFRLAGALQYAEFMLSPDLPKTTPHDGALRLLEQRVWERGICPTIRHFLVRRTLSLGVAEQAVKPWLHHRMLWLLWRCGERSAWVSQRIRAAFAKAIVRPTKRLELASYAVLYRLPGLMDRLVTAPQLRDRETLFQLLKSALPKDVTPAQIAFVAEALYRSKRRIVMAKFLAHTCGESGLLCRGAQRALQQLSGWRLSAPAAQIKALAFAAQKGLIRVPRKVWLTRLIKQYWKQPAGLHALAEASKLYDNTIEMQQLHLRTMTRVLELRTTPPVRMFHWRTMFYQKLNRFWYQMRSKPTKRKQFVGDLDLLEAAAMKFPHFYRGVLTMYGAFSYRFRKRFLRQLRFWLERSHDPIDLHLLQSLLRRFSQTQQKSFFQDLAKRVKAPTALRVLGRFAQLNGFLQTHLLLLKRLIELRPKDKKALYAYVDLLDRINKRQPEAHTLALRWLRLHPKQTSLPKLKARIKHCCVDRLERLWASRAFVAGLSRHGWGAVRGLWKELQPRLKIRQIRHVLNAMAALKINSDKERRPLASLAYQQGAYQLVIQLLTPLYKRKGLAQLERQMLAVAFDLTGHLSKGDGVWKRYLAHDNAPTPKAVFEALISQGRLKNDQRLVILGMLRKMRGIAQLRPLLVRDSIARLLRDGARTEAKARWLWLLGDKAGACLREGRTASNTHYRGAKTIWKIGVPYFGPLLFFSHCAWRINPNVAREVLSSLAMFLKKNRHVKIQLQGGAGPNEPDGAFLTQQRIAFVRAMLLGHGIPYHRVIVSARPIKNMCAKTLEASDKIRCHAFFRQVAIMPAQSSALTREWRKSVFDFASFRKRDADKDGVPDAEDACPLAVFNIRAVRRRYGRRWRYRRRLRRGRVTASKHPYARLYPKYRRAPKARIRHRRARGCLLGQGNMLSRKAGTPFLRFRGRLFRKRSYYLYLAAKRRLLGLANLMQIAPYLGRLRLEVLVSQAYYRKTPEYLANRRMKSLKRLFRRKKIKGISFSKRSPDLDISPKRQALVRVQMLDLHLLLPPPKKAKKQKASLLSPLSPITKP